MSFVSDSRSLAPKNKIVLIEIDGSEFGAGVHRLHYSPMPHTPAEILDAANEIMGREYLQENSRAENGTIEKSVAGVIIESSDGSAEITVGSVNKSTSKFKSVRIKYRWIKRPDNAEIHISFLLAAGQSQEAAATPDGVEVEGWSITSAKMAEIPDGDAIGAIKIRISGSGGYGVIEIMEVALVNIDSEDVNPKSLLPKSIWWNGDEFGYWPFSCEGIEFSNTQQSSPTLSVANLSGVIAAICRAYDQMVNAKVKIIQTTVQFLDARNFIEGNPDADPNESWIQLFFIDQMDHEDEEYCSFKLSSPLDLQGAQIPTRQVTTFCIWRSRGLYGKGLDIEEANGCSWDLSRPGIKYYDAKGNEVFDPSKDECGGCVKDCRLRFGQLYSDPKAANLPFGGFPASSLISS